MNESVEKVVIVVSAVLVGSFAVEAIRACRSEVIKRMEIKKKTASEILAIRKAKAVLSKRIDSGEYLPTSYAQLINDLEFETIVAFNE